MEDITEILNNAVTERLEIAYFELIKENEEVKQWVEAVKELSIKLYENTDIIQIIVTSATSQEFFPL